MTPLNVTQNPGAYYAWLQHVMSPDPQQGKPTGRTPDYPSALPWATRSKVQSVRDVEILDGRAAS